MTKFLKFVLLIGFLGTHVLGQSRRVWVLKEPDSIVEYDPSTFAAKGTGKVPPDVLKAARILQINPKGQMLFAPNTDDPSPDVGKTGDRFWYWDGQTETKIGPELIRVTSVSGSNHKVTESSPWAFLGSDGLHLSCSKKKLTKWVRTIIKFSFST